MLANAYRCKTLQLPKTVGWDYDPLFESRDVARLLDNRPSKTNPAAISSALWRLKKLVAGS